MKQRRFGQKVQNWHRPLGPNELSARYRRLRDTAPGVITQGGLSQEQPEFEYDDYDENDRGYEYWDWDCEGPDSPILHNSNLVWAICHPNQPLSSLEHLFPQEAPLPPLIHCPPDEFIYRLAEHVGRITRYQSDDPELTETINDAIGCNKARELVYQHLPQSAAVICLFAPFWCRSPLTWNPESDVSLEHHLFALYPVPSFLLTTRLIETFQNYKWLCWLILLGRSISLKKAAWAFDWEISGKLPHYIMQANISVWNPVQGVVYAEILRLGGTDQDFQRVIADASYQIDITDLSLPEEDIRFWRETVQWMITHRDELTDIDSQRILTWARHCYTEGEAGRGSSFHWAGRSVRAACEQAVVHEREQDAWLNLTRQYYWKSHGWDWAEDDGWSITELTTSKHLSQEGSVMRHCVGGYGWRCYTDASAIFSVRYKNQRQVTVELCPQTKAIVQIHGLCNRNATAEEQAVVSRWHRTVVTAQDTSSPPGNKPGGLDAFTSCSL